MRGRYWLEIWAFLQVFLIVFPVLGMALVALAVDGTEYFRNKRGEKAIRMAQDSGIGDGVTLLEGIRAYYGGDGRWGMLCGQVYVSVGEPLVEFAFKPVRVNRKTVRLEPRLVTRGQLWASREETEKALAPLVEAAKSRKPPL